MPVQYNISIKGLNLMTTSRIDILLKTITLLYRESELGTNSEDSSTELAKTILTTYNDNSKNNQIMGGYSAIINDLKYFIQDLINNSDGYDLESLLASLKMVLKDKSDIFEIIHNTLSVDMKPPGLKRSILTIRNRLNNYYKEYELKSLIAKASYAINTNALGDTSLLDYAKALSTNIEALTLTTNKTKDHAIVNEFDIASEKEVIELFSKVNGDNAESNLLKSSWEPLNEMLQGGFKRGAFVCIMALQHNYKSGVLRSIFAQLLRYNKPKLKDPTKKPLMVFISFEDDADITVEFLYKYLYFSEFKELPDLKVTTPSEAAAYVKDKLCVNGYHVKMLRVNPSEWTYKHIFNKCLQYEADGYEIHTVAVDYLSKLPTTGCTQGPTGTDVRDLFNRVRNYMSAKDILFITPHQLSTEAKQLIRNGVSALTFVKEMAGKGYTEGSRQIDQVVDLGIYIGKAKVNKEWVLTFQRDKDRRPGIVDDDKLYFTLPFPKKAPIPEIIENSSVDGEINTDDIF